MKKLAIATLIGAAAAFALYAASSDKTTAPQVTFVALKGEQLTTHGLRGKVVLVNFWATDCAICLKEMPDMVKTYSKYRPRGFEYVAVAMKYDPPNYMINYAEKNALPLRVALDPQGELAKAFGEVKFTPTTFVIDKRGNIVSRILGEPDFTRLHELLEEKLAEAA